MKTKLTKKEAKEKIEDFFKKKELEAKYVKKIKRLAMKFHIRLGKYRNRFCKDCNFDLKYGKVRINKIYKIVICVHCGMQNKCKINNS